MTYPALYTAHSHTKRANLKLGRKEKKAQEVLFGLLELFLKTGKPIGSQTLKENGFDHLSSATIRNYFAYLEQEKLLHQAHSSGGRSPTDDAWRLYVNAYSQHIPDIKEITNLQEHFNPPSEVEHSIVDYLQNACDRLSRWSNCASFIISPVFEHDQPQHVRLWPINTQRTLCVTLSQFGIARQESLSLDLTEQENLLQIQAFIEKKMQDPYCKETKSLNKEDEALALALYNELMVRHLVDLTKEKSRRFIKSGLSNLLQYTEFSSPDQLAPVLSFFENNRSKDQLMKELFIANQVQAWIGQEAQDIFIKSEQCSLIVGGFAVGQHVVGAVGIICPKRINYRGMIQSIDYLSRVLSQTLTQHYFTHRIDLCEESNEENNK